MMGGKALLLAFVLSAAAVCCGQKELFKHNSLSKYFSHRYGNSSCQDSPVEVRERNASVIFSGTVRDLEPNPEDAGTQRATVEIKRILKGSQVISRIPLALFPGDGRRYVIVEGIGSGRICRSFVRKHDTRIFLVNKGLNGELALDSSLERITMENINRLDSVIKHRHLPNEAQTTLSQVTSKSSTEPEQDSSSTRHSSSDSSWSYQATTSDNMEWVGVSIGTILHQSPTATTRMDNVKADRNDPCLGKKCSFGAQCVVSVDGLTAQCQCLEKCDDFGDSVGSSPLCGSDGRDYPNTCEMLKIGCKEMRLVEEKLDGKCDPCRDVICPFGQFCQLDDVRRPVCRCGEICPMIFEPVCATNGKTYANECLMREDACRRQMELRVIFSGECSLGENPCSGKVCGPGEQCHVDMTSEVRCVCPPECPLLVRPVCGSNGRTYDSECHLRRSACLEREEVVISRHGDCDDSGPCRDFRCNDTGGHCVLRDGLPTCVCPFCSEEFEPVCGSDNKSYANECKLRRENCSTSEMITMRYRGRCLSDVCSQKKCHFYSVCEIDSQGVTGCICPEKCEESISVVCGSDGVTYNNECELKSASCKHQKVITVRSNGVCDACDGIACGFGGECVDGECVCRHNCSSVDDPVCANNDVTYPNECTLLKESCHQRISLEVLHAGSCSESSGSGDFELNCDETNCKYGGRCDLTANGTLHCVCHFDCDALRSPVCGSDGRTYGNECQLKEDSCRKQISIQVQPMENCEDIDEELCDGEPVLVNPVTGREYNCHRGKDICPAGSYCHKLGTIAQCCREVQLSSSDNCVVSQFGCCPDGITSALGPKNAGCPNVCQCNALGSLSRTCDPVSRQCACRHGVGGVKCDRCRSNFWGLPQIAEGSSGCLPCDCNVNGSMREDCEQTTGRCTCRPGISGRQCNICPNGRYLQANGCSDIMLNDDMSSSSSFDTSNRTCEKLCEFGAVCRLSVDGEPACVCPMNCSTEQGRETTFVCGSDGVTYASLCQMVLFACRSQINITASRLGPCHAFRAVVPWFSGHSYLQLRMISPAGGRQLSIEINFRPQRDSGILLFASGDIDFVSVVLKDGFVEFSYDLGSGRVLLRSPDRVGLGVFHRLVAQRSDRSGSLKVDNGTEVTGTSPGSLTSLNINSPFFLGNVVERDSEKLQRVVGVGEGFLGCIQSLVIKDSRQNVINYNLSSDDSSDVEKRVDIGNCSSLFLCSGFPCMNGGSCLETDDSVSFRCRCLDGFSGVFCENRVPDLSLCSDSVCGLNGRCQSSSSSREGEEEGGGGGGGGGFRCLCLRGFTGSRCEIETVIGEEDEDAVSFDGSTFLKYRNSVSTVRKSQATNKFEIEFRSSSSNGLLLLMRKSNSIEADYLAVAIREGRVEVSLNLGKEAPTDLLFMSSPVNVTDGHWHSVLFSRANRRSQLTVDHKFPVVTKLSSPGATHLDTDGHLWIGGCQQRIHGLPEAYLSGFHGCIKYIRVNDEVIDLVKDREVKEGAISFCSTTRH